MKELKHLRDTPLTTLQFHRALQQLQGQMAISAENQENNALSMGKQMLYYHHAPLWQETFHKISQTTPIMLQETAIGEYNDNNISILQYD